MPYPQDMNSRNGQRGELDLLKLIRARAAQVSPRATYRGLQRGIGDDCALLRVGPGEELAVTTDLSIEGRHFRIAWHSPESIGHRTLARGLSDLAAMGARPVAAFLSLGLPKTLVENSRRREPWVDRFLSGFFILANAYRVPLAGGDLAESPIAVADIALAGAVGHGKALLRSGARPGHLVYVTGVLGGASAGLAQLEELAANRKSQSGPPRIPGKLQSLLAPHLAPQPRIAQGRWLARRGRASAAIDLSDGLSRDLAHLCEESRVAAEVDAQALPIHASATLAQALHGGEDYELLFTAPPAVRVPHSIGGVRVTRIGRILRRHKGRPAVALVTAQDVQKLSPQGWEHFS